MSYATIKIKLQETGRFFTANRVLGNKFTIISSGNTKSVSGVINSVFITISSAYKKYDFDILFFNNKINTVTENNKILQLLEDDALNCFGKIRIEANGDMADDYLNPIGGYYFAHLFNMNLPFSGKEIEGIAVYQDGRAVELDNNTFITVNYDLSGYTL